MHRESRVSGSDIEIDRRHVDLLDLKSCDRGI